MLSSSSSSRRSVNVGGGGEVTAGIGGGGSSSSSSSSLRKLNYEELLSHALRLESENHALREELDRCSASLKQHSAVDGGFLSWREEPNDLMFMRSSRPGAPTRVMSSSAGSSASLGGSSESSSDFAVPAAAAASSSVSLTPVEFASRVVELSEQLNQLGANFLNSSAAATSSVARKSSLSSVGSTTSSSAVVGANRKNSAGASPMNFASPRGNWPSGGVSGASVMKNPPAAPSSNSGVALLSNNVAAAGGIGVNSGGISSNSSLASQQQQHSRHLSLSDKPLSASWSELMPSGLAAAAEEREKSSGLQMSLFNRLSSVEQLGTPSESVSRSQAIAIPSASSLIQSARTSGAGAFDEKLMRKPSISRSLEDSSLFHAEFGSSSLNESSMLRSSGGRDSIFQDRKLETSVLQPYATSLKIPRSPAIPISSGKLRASAPEFKAPIQFGGMSAPSSHPHNLSSSSDASASPPATSSSSSPPEVKITNLFYTSNNAIADTRSAQTPDSASSSFVDISQVTLPASVTSPSILGKMCCFLLCDVSREVSLESMRRCVQEKFDLPRSEKYLSDSKGNEDSLVAGTEDEDSHVRIEFGEGGPGAGRVAFVFVSEKHAQKLHNVKRFRAVVDGVKMRMKVTHVPMNLVEQYR
eukprot:TRINITY_DN2895_c0_g1_i3.p1 TRINITY_DN2895_c0_g1~~TRINITY_DN2895_c0_g1_i3.p1  ORF type:complete len:643 (+),score=146.37 TRINITY_DN2895_c0_g1_i3:3599-5527(+)